MQRLGDSTTINPSKNGLVSLFDIDLLGAYLHMKDLHISHAGTGSGRYFYLSCGRLKWECALLRIRKHSAKDDRICLEANAPPGQCRSCSSFGHAEPRSMNDFTGLTLGYISYQELKFLPVIQQKWDVQSGLCGPYSIYVHMITESDHVERDSKPIYGLDSYELLVKLLRRFICIH